MNDNSSFSSNSTNVIHQLWFQYFTKVCNGLVPAMCVCGLFGNALSTAVYLRVSFRKLSINILLAVLSISDLCLLLLLLLTYSYNPFDLISPLWSMYFKVYMYPITTMFHFGSVWLLVLITIERWLAVCRPLLVAIYCTRTKTIFNINFVIAISILFNAVRFWEYTIEPGGVSPLLRKMPFYSLWHATVASMILLYFVPLGVMITMNCLVVREITRASTVRRLLSRYERKDRKTAKMLAYVVLCFICCYSLSFILNLIEVTHVKFYITDFGLALNELNNGLMVFNAATTFLFYFKFSSRYRLAAYIIFSSMACRNSQPRGMEVAVYGNERATAYFRPRRSVTRDSVIRERRQRLIRMSTPLVIVRNSNDDDDDDSNNVPTVLTTVL